MCIRDRLNEAVNIKEETAYVNTQKYISLHKSTIQDSWNNALAQIENANDINPLLNHPINLSKYRQVQRPSTATLHFQEKLYDSIKAFSQKEGVTINVIVQFAWHKLLQIYSSRQQSIVGTTISGRDLPIEGIEDSVGLYINTLPLIINWNNDHSILSQLQLIQKQIANMNANSFVDLAKLQNNGQRLFHSLFVFENYPIPERQVKGQLKISFRDAIEDVDYPLSILASEYNNKLTIQLKYDANHLTNDKANQHLQTLKSIINQVIEQPSQSHTQVSLISPESFDKLIYQWNATDKVYPKDKTIPQLFEEQVKKHPNNIALVYEEEELTYQQLNQKTNQLARFIRAEYFKKTKKQLQPDTLIPLYLDRGLERFIAIMAVLKAGGAYVAIDTNYPQKRVEIILEDTKASIVLCQKHLALENNPFIPKNKTLFIDLSEKIYQTSDTSNLKAFAKPNHLAYLIYTSGTTGQPKGVMIEYRSLVDNLFAMKQRLSFTQKHSFLALATYSFDPAYLELFLPLITGGVVYIASQEAVSDTAELQILINQYQPSYLQATPTTWQLLMDSKWKNETKLIALTGGEAISMNLKEYLVKISPKVWNLYGPTETTIWSTTKELIAGKPISIGPVSYTHLTLPTKA